MAVSFSRRALALGLSTVALGTGAQTPAAKAANPPTPSGLTPLAQMKVGRFTVTALSDGYLDMPYATFPGRTPEQVDDIPRCSQAGQ